jgi:diaminopimelate epimerase
MRVLKGHGTGNDFVLVPDLDGALELTPELVRALCARHTGIGADGVLRVVRAAKDPDGARYAADAEFFMDYRNADGSLAEMCGNGVRVFMAYLQRACVVDHDAAVATRGGIVRVQTGADGVITVDMGQPRVLADRPVVTAAPLPPTPGARVELPNPHVVVEVGEPADLAALELSDPPLVEPTRPGGQNVEFVVRTGPRQLLMRVHERGVGETQSCGTGICAAVVAAATAEGSERDDTVWQVQVPGGSCSVTWRADGTVLLSGPAVIVAELDLGDSWLEAALAAAGSA